MSDTAVSLPMILHPADIEIFDRGTGVKTTPLVGKWNCQGNRVTTGITAFEVGTALPLHTHNVEETVIVIEGQAIAVVGEKRIDLEVEDVTWVPAGVPHCFINRGSGRMRIYWVYGGRAVTRTICASGETFEHLSEKDRGGTKAS